MVSLDIKIGIVRSQSQTFQLRAQLLHPVDVAGETGLQFGQLCRHRLLHLVQTTVRMTQVYLLQTHAGVEVVHRESVRVVLAVEPDIPQKQRIGNLRITLQKSGEVQDMPVVQRGLHTDFMQTVGKAVEVLDGIAISLEDIGILVYLMRHLGGTLQQEVVVAVYTSYQAAAQLRCVQRIHQHHLLALCQRGGRGKHHLKITFLILELRQQRPPESDVVIAFHIRHYAPACSLGGQLAGGIQIGGSKVMS